ncbi:hypothetical protein [Microvirga massiliensis]|uniref:hypothetical protein n=1 Tax=Microvirga massiliensis TaxID=1033741 RepID=UPI00062BE2EE|nr:hypothetical protein [Microvirga massiliensis]
MRRPADYEAEGLDPFEPIEFTHYDPGTGVILAHGQTQRIVLDEMEDQGLALIRGVRVEPETHRIDIERRVPIEKTPEELVDIDRQIMAAPQDLTGGPTLADIFSTRP